jgi:hypothetical protein
LGAGKIGAQPFARLKLYRADQQRAVASLAAGKPGERALALVNGDGGAAGIGLNIAAGERKMLRAEPVDGRLLVSLVMVFRVWASACGRGGGYFHVENLLLRSFLGIIT